MLNVSRFIVPYISTLELNQLVLYIEHGVAQQNV